MIWREYHESTKHTPQLLSRIQYSLDWANMPDPFRHYEGVPVFDLPADPPTPDVPVLELLQGAYGTTQVSDGPTFLSQLLFHSAAISASKMAPSNGQRYALRVNPSSGNLHPTEFHFLTHRLKQWPDGQYHYRPSSHMAEQRAIGDLELMVASEFAPIVFVLTSIAWREAWKYRNRAYRYCLHDMGHAWQSLALAARALGCDSYAIGQFPDDEVAQFCRLNEDEWPMLVVKLYGNPIPVSEPAAGQTVWFGGRANRLSTERIRYPGIDSIHAATKLSFGHQSSRVSVAHEEPSPLTGSGKIKLPSPASSTRAFGEISRTRRSALDFVGGMKSMSFAQLSTVLAASIGPFDSDFASTRFVQLYLYVHRVEELRPGVYRYYPEHAQLEQIRSGDQRVAVAGLSLGQDLAGNACVAFSMIADLNHAVRSHGERGYRYVHFEAGAIGQRLYLAAEALGLRATGIGAFFDDQVSSYLNLASGQGQVVYHFAIGYPIFDPRVLA
jgi:SagB-type dehydrogenase family enzyme